MTNHLKKIVASILAAMMCVSTMMASVLAAENIENTTEISPEGLITKVTTATTTTTDEDGNIVVLVMVEKSTVGTTEDGVAVDRKESSTVTTTTDAAGNVIGESTIEDGSETKKWTEEDNGDVAGQPEVKVDLIPGETTTGAATETTTVTDENGTTTTTTTDRTVTAETSNVEVTVNDSSTGLVGEQETVLTGLAPVYDKDENGKKEDKDGLFDRNYLSTNTTSDTSKWTNIPPEGEYRYIGEGEHSKYYVGVVKVIYRKDEDGNTVYDESGNPVIEKLVNAANGTDHTSDGEILDEIVPEYEIDNGFAGSRAQTFMLMDKNGNRVYAYCCDVQTGAVNGTWYSVSNLEDNEYYTPEAEGHIRAIATNGYWGTTDVPDENGEYASGSLEGIKAKMIEAINNGEIERYVQVPVRDTSTEGAGKIQVDEDGNPIYYEEKMDLLEILANMTEGEALLATQAAIWSFANGSAGATSGIDGSVVVTPDWYRNHQIGYSKTEGEPLDDVAGARVAAMYNWLINLQTEEESTIVINEKNFVEDMSLTVGDKVADHKANQDDNKDNDVYNASLNFNLAFVPGEKDDLLVQLTYTDLDGNEVTLIKRLVGTNSEGQTYETIKPEADGSYVLNGLKLSENEEFNFDLRLEGTQYLENGVYVYSAIGGRDASQTFVGVAEGTRNVDFSAGVATLFAVDENDEISTNRTWHDEEDPDDGLVEIPDEDIPEASPDTGDASTMWMLLSALSGCGLLSLTFAGKKRKED